MSERHLLADAERVADDLRTLLAPACTRAAIAGSVRRLAAEVKDIELVVEPRILKRGAGDLWGSEVEVDALDERLSGLMAAGTIALRRVEVHRKDGSIEDSQRDGASYKALVFQGISIDLFIVRPPADWGVIFAIRTGPGDWNQRIVTDCQRFLRRVAGGRVYHSGEWIPCPTEADFFRAVGQRWLEPSERRVERVKIEAVSA